MTSPVITPEQPNQSLPDTACCGNLLAWQVATPLAPGVSVFYILTGVIANIPTRITIAPSPTNAGGNASFSVASSVTALWSAGKYQWICFWTDSSGNRDELSRGTIWLTPDPGGANPADPRSQNEILFGNIRALLQGKALDDAVMYKIGQRELTKMPIKELLYWEGVVASRIRRERIRRGEFVRSRTVGVSFTAASCEPTLRERLQWWLFDHFGGR